MWRYLLLAAFVSAHLTAFVVMATFRSSDRGRTR
jgi:hypothetical protein